MFQIFRLPHGMTFSSNVATVSASKILQGSVLILISNVIYIGNNYLVAWTRINASEIALVRGGFQVIVFGIIVWRGQRTNESGLRPN